MVVQVPKPSAQVVKILPPLVVAYPLIPKRDTVMKEAPKGRVTLKLKPGPWIIATATTSKLGAKRRYKARLVVVGSAAQTLTTKEVATPAPGGIAIGEIGFGPNAAGVPLFTIEDSFRTDAPGLAKLAPCRPPITPLMSKDPLWQAIRKAAVQAGRTGPKAIRPAARAAAAQLGASTPAATFSGMTDTEGSRTTGSFTITDSNGQTVWSGKFEAKAGDFGTLYKRAFNAALAAFCAPSRILVEASTKFESQDIQGTETYKGTGVIEAKVVGRERVSSNGVVARGDFEYEEPVLWGGREPGATILVGKCTAQPTAVWEGFGLISAPLGPPTSIAVYRPDSTFLVFLPSAAVVRFDKVAPAADCTGTGGIRAFFLTDGYKPHQVVVPGLNKPTELTGQGTVGTTTTKWTTTVKITRLPSIAP